MLEDKSYFSILEKKLTESPPERKSDRTRASIKIAVAKLLEDVGYQNLRVADIAKKAGIGTGTFHDYFENRTHVAKEVLEEFLKTLTAPRNSDHGYNSAFAAIYFSNKGLIDVFQRNSGIMNCLFQLADQDEGFSSLWRRISLKWYKIVSDLVVERYLPETDRSFMFMNIYLLGGMIDEFLRGLYVHKDEAVLAVLEDNNLGNDAIAYFLTIVWYRGIFGKNPTDIPNEIDPEIVSVFTKNLGFKTS